MCISLLYLIRKIKLEANLANMSWKVKWEDISLRNLSPAHGIAVAAAAAAALTNEVLFSFCLIQLSCKSSLSILICCLLF